MHVQSKASPLLFSHALVVRTALTQKHLFAVGVVEADGRRIPAIVDAAPAIESAAAELEFFGGNGDRAAGARGIDIRPVLQSEILERLRRVVEPAFVRSWRDALRGEDARPNRGNRK